MEVYLVNTVMASHTLTMHHISTLYLTCISLDSNSFSQSTNDNYMFNQNNTGSNGITNQISTSGALVDNVSNHVHPPIVSKQVPFTNRCRSPSPGLFQDINMFNFSSDTLFGTNYLEDHKDPSKLYS